MDCDLDGFPAEVDCDDHDAKVHPGATDKPANKRDEDCSGRDAPYPRLDSAVLFTFQPYRRFAVFDGLHVRPVRAGSTIRLRCNGKACPFKVRTRKVATFSADVDLSKLVRGVKLRKREWFEVSVTKPGTIGISRRRVVRGGKRLEQINRCLSPSHDRPVACRT